MKTLSIYNRLIIYFLTVSLVPLIGFGVLYHLQVNRITRGNFLDTMSLIAVESAYHVERDLELRRREVLAWADLLPMQGGGDDEAGAQRVDRALDRLVAAYPMYDLLLLVDESHKVLAANRHDREGQPIAVDRVLGNYVSNGPWFVEASSKGFFLSEVRRSNVVGKVYGSSVQSVSLTAPIRREGGRAGFLLAYLNWSYVQEILSIAQASHAEDIAGSVYMLHVGTSRFLAHPNADLHGESYPLKVDLQEVLKLNPTGVLHLDWPQAKTISYAQVRGDSAIGQLPWVVCVEVPDEVIFRQARLLRVMFLLLTVFSALGIIIIVYFISRRFSVPLLQLVSGAQEIAAGNMDVEIPVESVDELGVLANTFNQMLDSLRERDEQLRLTNQQLEEANRLKSEFLANVSHELRTPMNSIIGFTTLVLQRAGDRLPELQQQNLGKVRKNALRLLRLLNSILDLSKIESGGMDVVVEEFMLSDMLAGCLHTISPLLEGRRIETTMDIPPTSLRVYTDRQKVQQILINLLGNAAKFTEEGYIRCGYEVSSEPLLVGEVAPGPWVRIWVEDSGIGIHERDLKYIFAEFRQVDGSPSRKYAGTGLGLSISKKLAKLLGGDILVRSELGFGSTMTLVIPAQHLSAQPLVRDETAHPMPTVRPAEDHTEKGKAE